MDQRTTASTLLEYLSYKIRSILKKSEPLSSNSALYCDSMRQLEGRVVVWPEAEL